MMAENQDNSTHDSPRLILASQSPRRASLLTEYGYEFEVVPPLLHEPRQKAGGLSPAQIAEAISYFKARSVAERIRRGIILGADTIVSLGHELFGKPADRAHARRTLQTLAGTTHQVITGVTLFDAGAGFRMINHAQTSVTMRPLTPKEIDAYLDTGAWEGKAGAYGIQDLGDAFVTRVEGSFTNVVGLPMELIGQLFCRFDLHPTGARAPRPPWS
ncbi:MAG: septum formation protein Maf [Phycisphaerales bacterium]|nr:MAG: septum formation protein Maf [Phycisphaerales bacterium]